MILTRVFQIHIKLNSKWKEEQGEEIKRFITDKLKCVEKFFSVEEIEIYKLGEKNIYYVTTTKPQINSRVSPSFIMYIDLSIESGDTPTKTILPQCSTGGWAGSRLGGEIQ